MRGDGLPQMFENLPEEKRGRVLNAAMAEFASKGYDQASTNEIVKQAGISKGLLFHYFGNKKALFLSLYDYAAQTGIEQVYAQIEMHNPDLIERLRMGQRVKIELLQKYPPMFDFLQAAFLEQSPEVRSGVEDRNRRYMNENIAKIYQGIDLTLFRPGLDIQKALKTMFWVFEGLANEIKQKNAQSHQPLDYDDVFRQSDEYLDFLRILFYAEG